MRHVRTLAASAVVTAAALTGGTLGWGLGSIEVRGLEGGAVHTGDVYLDRPWGRAGVYARDVTVGGVRIGQLLRQGADGPWTPSEGLAKALDGGGNADWSQAGVQTALEGARSRLVSERRAARWALATVLAAAWAGLGTFAPMAFPVSRGKTPGRGRAVLRDGRLKGGGDDDR